MTMTAKLNINIHPSSVVENGAQLGTGVEIGPFCYVGADVSLADNVQLLSHVSIRGNTTIGEGSRVFPFASLGSEPQDLKFGGEASSLEIGKNCTIRESVTMNPGTTGGGLITRVGDNCTFLVNSHVAHDCIVGDGAIFSNNVMLAGHCSVGDHVILGGGSAAHQFCRIGHHAFIGGLAGIEGDLIPFGMVIGARGGLAGLNLIGMKRAGIPRESIHAVRNAYKIVFAGDRPVQDAATEIRATEKDPHAIDMLDFITASAERPLCTP